MKRLIKGEKRHIGMKVNRESSLPFTIETATYDVMGIQEGECEIDQGNKNVYFLIDTTKPMFLKGNSYVAQFTVTIEGLEKIIKGEVIVSIN